MFNTYSQWLEVLNDIRTLWKHDGNPLRPHALLTGDGHSDGFFHAQTLLWDRPKFAYEMLCDFHERLLMGEIEGLEHKPVKVISPAMGATPLATLLGVVLNIGSCVTMPSGEGKNKTFELEKRFIIKGMHVIAAEDVITSGDSVGKSIKVAEDHGAIVAPIIVAVCNRSGLTEIGGRKIVAAFDIPMTNWTAAECPLCKKGSKAIRPKEKVEADNWFLLSKPYD